MPGLIALLAGAFGALALAPIGLGPALVVPMVAAVWLLDGTAMDDGGLRPAALRRAFGVGWWLGFGYFVRRLLVAVGRFPHRSRLHLGAAARRARASGPSSPCSSAPASCWRGCSGCRGPARVLALALGLGSAEWARGHLFTGFPWNPLGMGLGGNLVTAQLAALVGLDGMTLVTIALFAAPADARLGGRPASRAGAPMLLALAGLAAICAWGGIRLAQPGPRAMSPDVMVRIVQPGLRPDAEFSAEKRRQDRRSLHRAVATRRHGKARRALRRHHAGVAGIAVFPSS